MKVRMSVPIVTIGVATLIALTYQVAFRVRERRDASPSRDSEEIAELRSEVELLRKQNAAALLVAGYANRPLTAQGEGADRQKALEDQGNTAAPVPAPPTPPQVPPEQAAAAQLDDHFTTERLDPSWSEKATHEATVAINKALPPGSTIKRVECRATLCRVESFHESVSAFREFTDKTFLDHHRALWNAGITSMVREQTSSGVTAVSYIAKEGQEIPPLKEE